MFPRQIISIFGTGDVLYFEFAVRFMRIFLFMVLVNGVQLISSNFFAAIGKPIKGVILSLTRQVFFLVPLLLILPLFMGIDGILFAGPIADVPDIGDAPVPKHAGISFYKHTQASRQLCARFHH